MLILRVGRQKEETRAGPPPPPPAGKTLIGNLIEDNNTDFVDVTVACEDGHQLEAHKVILDGSRPQTTIRTH